MRKRPDFYLLIKQLCPPGPPRYFFNHVRTRESYERKIKAGALLEILGVIDPSPDFVAGKMLQGKQKAIGLVNQLNARVGRVSLSSGGHQQAASKAPPSSRDTARLLEKRNED